MPTPYDRAIAFTDGLLDLRTAPPFTFSIGSANIKVSPNPNLVTGPTLAEAGVGLKSMACSLSLQGHRSATLRTKLYISAGPRTITDTGFPEGTHYLYVHDTDGRKALEIPMHQVVTDSDQPVTLSAEINLPEARPEAEAHLWDWLRSHGLAFSGDQVILGAAADYSSLLINLLTLHLLMQHMCGHYVIPALVDELPPRNIDGTGEEVLVTFRDYSDECAFEISAVNSRRLPPNQVLFQVEVGEKQVAMWPTRFDDRTKSINTCEGDYNNLTELRDALGLRAGDKLRLAPLGPRRYRLEKVEDPVYAIGIFIRLGQAKTVDGHTMNGFETMERFRQDAQNRGYTWFSTDILSSGMAQETVKEFKDAIAAGRTVVMYIMVSANGGGTNQIEYKAHVRDLHASANPETPCPEPGGAPPFFTNAGRIWLKLTNLDRQRLDPRGFVVDRTGSNLADAVTGSAFMFGYIRRSAPVAPPPPDLTEPEVVDKLCAYLHESGFRFSHEMVLNYWISLKTKPFVILAGLSGSGKSKLPLLVAKALGAQFCRVAVSPGWTEDSDLLGYRNPLDPAGAFQVTDFTAFLLKARADREDRLWFACLDEMNLARVEHYFAKFLSAMEGLDPADRMIQLHTGTDAAVPQAVPIPIAFLFTGTVNMDETTHAFSPKVLDRSNLVEFDIAPDELLADLPPLTTPGWSINLTATDFRRFCATSGDARFRPDLVEIARILQPVRAHFGFRVREEIERFIANGVGLLAPEELFDLQIHQKILPKVRGSGTALAGALQQLHDLAEERGWRRSRAKLQEMQQRLADDGITHFYR